MGNLYTIDNNIINHNMGILRNKNTKKKEFNNSLDIISALLMNEIAKNILVETKEIETPVATTKCQSIVQDIIFIPILRAGLGMLKGSTFLISDYKVGHIGMYRDEETLKVKNYFSKIPKVKKNSLLIILDPMLATGNSIEEAIRTVKNKVSDDVKIVISSILSIKESVNRILDNNCDIDIYTAQIDEKLDERGFIVPGLGDAGDRIFGTDEIYE